MLHRHCQNRQDRRYQRRNPNSIINNGNEAYPRRQTLIGSVLAPLREQKQNLLRPTPPLQQPQQAYRQHPPPQQQQQQQPYYNNQQPYEQQPYPYQYQPPPYNPTWRDQPQPRSQDRDLPVGQERGYRAQDYDDNNSNYYYDNNDRHREGSQGVQQSADYSPTYQTMGTIRGGLEPRPRSSSLLSQRKEEEIEQDRRR